MTHCISQIPSLGVLLIVSLGMTSCGGPDTWKANPQKAGGHITINGGAPVDAMIILKPLNDPVDARRSDPWSPADKSGNFQLTTYKRNDDVPPRSICRDRVLAIRPRC